MARHKHADLIHAWAEGATIQSCAYKEPYEKAWFDCREAPAWDLEMHYRIKPKEPEWWENIPEHGILVKNKELGHIYGATRNEVFINPELYTPLTNEEIDKFKRSEA